MKVGREKEDRSGQTWRSEQADSDDVDGSVKEYEKSNLLKEIDDIARA